ncbi:hypothetical protein KM043_007462 [Ampulex compressa]|nr:hypothetical protein KM043_007462 [Ampulex compressa]
MLEVGPWFEAVHRAARPHGIVEEVTRVIPLPKRIDVISVDVGTRLTGRCRSFSAAKEPAHAHRPPQPSAPPAAGKNNPRVGALRIAPRVTYTL